MPRSTADATRFTATGPYATSKSSTVSLGNAPRDETPQEKVARLREAARRARIGQEPKFDRYWAIGRTWADRAHKATIYTLVTFTFVSGVYASVSLGDMILYNRRKRAAWYQEREDERAEKLVEAREALARGMANDDQMLLINQERAAAEARLAQEQPKEGFNTRLFKWVTGASKLEETQNGSVGVEASKIEHETTNNDRQAGLGIIEAVEDKRRIGEKPLEQMHLPGGPLDQQAQQNANEIAATAKGWTSWFTRG
ncbi:MAG: hypothetical protein M1820_005587 [Bogoriella megaspora]|nr:MAG: hypothetical protein M1820_005587 [Bogoriella megaspora]